MIYIPIGSNCSVATYLRQQNIRKHAYPFDWNCTSLKMFYEMLINDFSGYLDDIFIGTEIKRHYVDNDNDDNEIKVSNEKIYPVICKKYNVLFPHDYVLVDENTCNKVKEKYLRRIQRFRDAINSNEKICLIYQQSELNDWQKSVYHEYCSDPIPTFENKEYLTKIKDFFSDKPNIQIISLDEAKKLKKINLLNG